MWTKEAQQNNVRIFKLSELRYAPASNILTIYLFIYLFLDTTSHYKKKKIFNKDP